MVAGDRNTIVWDATGILKFMAVAPGVAEDRNGTPLIVGPGYETSGGRRPRRPGIATAETTLPKSERTADRNSLVRAGRMKLAIVVAAVSDGGQGPSP
jgi:hypothetical protein